jgi:hypothetical protein
MENESKRGLLERLDEGAVICAEALAGFVTSGSRFPSFVIAWLPLPRHHGGPAFESVAVSP